MLILRAIYCLFPLTDKDITPSINSFSNLVVTGTNPLRKHQIKNVFFLIRIHWNSTGMAKNIWPGICFLMES